MTGGGEGLSLEKNTGNRYCMQSENLSRKVEGKVKRVDWIKKVELLG